MNSSRIVNHLVSEFYWTGGHFLPVVHVFMEFSVAIRRQICFGKGVFQSQTVLIYKVAATTDFPVRLLTSEQDLYQSLSHSSTSH